MRTLFPYLFVIFALLAGCTTEPDLVMPNRLPKTFFWINPDSLIREGVSRQKIHWWGEDPDGVITGYLFAVGKFLGPGHTLPHPDTIGWRFTIRTDSTVAFPLLTRRDTFDIAIRAIDNTFKYPTFHSTAEVLAFLNATIRFVPKPYWDVNDNGSFDAGDVELPTLNGAFDPAGATQPIPIRNQAPKIFYAFDPNDPNAPEFQQPDTTFTAATFSWFGTDEDGDQTIAKYIIALNDTNNVNNRFSLPGNVKLASLVVPRFRSDTATGEVSADIYTGKYITPPQKIGTIGGLRLNNFNTFYVQAVDVAGDSSNFIRKPSGALRWYVKKPVGKLLIVSDYILSDSASALSFYQTAFSQVSGGQFANYEVLNIARGLNAQNKKDQKISRMVPPFFDPALLFTLHLFDLVFWFTDPYPGLNVAQVPLYDYVHSPSHQGKVIYSTMFETTVDPSGALKDFAPIDSVSPVDLSNSRLFPTQGDTRIPGGFYVYSDSTDPGNIYPNLRFNTNVSIHATGLFVRPIYKRADSKYIYHLQEDNRGRYAYGATLNDFHSISSVGNLAWACGVDGIIFHTTDAGTQWKQQETGTHSNLQTIQFFDASNGIAVGGSGTILQTANGGESWNDKSVVTFATFLGSHFLTQQEGYIVGTGGLLIKTTNAGAGWNSLVSGTSRNINGIHFANSDVGIAVGDSGLVLATSNGGATWTKLVSGTTRKLNAVSVAQGFDFKAVGANGVVLNVKSTNSGSTWDITLFTINGAVELQAISFLDGSNGWMGGTSGALYKTINGGTTWVTLTTGVTQVINGIAFSNANEGWCVGTTGIILRTTNGGSSVRTQPDGNLQMGVINGDKSFIFLGLPLHRLDGSGGSVNQFLEYVLSHEFGF